MSFSGLSPNGVPYTCDSWPEDKTGDFNCAILDIDITHRCNLRCDGCMHYCNYGIGGDHPFGEGGQWMRNWAGKVKPARFTIVGGEPLLHPGLHDYMLLGAELFPDSRRRVYTNGWFLHATLGKWLQETGFDLYISMYPVSSDKVLRRDEGIRRFLSEVPQDVSVQAVQMKDHWRRPHLGFGSTLRPHNSDPVGAWSWCTARHAVQLHDNRLWKCCVSAYLPMALGKLGLMECPEWQPFLDQHSLGTEATYDDVAVFALRGAEAICEMCPDDGWGEV